MLSITTGLRTEELRALRWTEVDLDAVTVAVYRAVRATADTKTPKSRRVLGHRGTATTETVHRKVTVPELRRGAEVMDRLFT